jgi:hypothetical protein
LFQNNTYLAEVKEMTDVSKEQMRNLRKEWKKEEDIRFKNFLTDMVNLLSHNGKLCNHERYGFVFTKEDYNKLAGATGKGKYRIRDTISKLKKQEKLIHIKFGEFDNKAPLCAYTSELVKFFQNKLEDNPSVKSSMETKYKKVSNEEMKKILINTEKILLKITNSEYKNGDAIAEVIDKQIDGEDAKTWLLTVLLRREALALKTIIENVSKQQSDMMYR